MSYERHFTPPKEVMEKYNVHYVESIVNDLQHELLYYCMSDTSYKEGAHMSIHLKICSILNRLKVLMENKVRQITYNTYDEENGDVWFSGWNYANCYFSEEEIENLQNRTLQELFLLATVVKTPNFFDDEETFYEKVNAINREIESFTDFLIEAYNCKIIEELEKYENSEEDSDELEEPEEIQESTN